MTDLTEIDKPFGELPRETQIALFEAWLDGGVVEFSAGTSWSYISQPRWFNCDCYRIKPMPLTPDIVDWSHLDKRWRYMARDEGGDVYVFEQEPLVNCFWDIPAGEVTRIVSCKYSVLASYKRGTVDWKDSLVKRPEGV